MGTLRLKVGLFVTMSFFILAAAVMWLAGSQFFQPVDTYYIVFTKSVSGLLPGAAVEYQGVTVGKVAQLRLTPDVPPQVAVTIVLEPGTPVRQDTTALLIGSLVTGIRIIELEGGSAKALPLPLGGAIPVKEGEFEAFRDRASAIAERLLTVLTRIENELLSTDNQTALATFLRNTASLSESLRRTFDEVSTPETRASLTAMVENLAQAAAGIKSATDAINTIRQDLFEEGKGAIIQFRQTAAATANLARDVAQLARHVDGMVTENRGELDQLLGNLKDASRHLKETAEALRADPSEVIWGRTFPEKDIPDK